MDIDRHSKKGWIGFHFTPEDYRKRSPRQLEDFRGELKERLPREAWHYNGDTGWWSIRRAYVYILDELIAKYLKDKRQGGLFES